MATDRMEEAIDCDRHGRRQSATPAAIFSLRFVYPLSGSGCRGMLQPVPMPSVHVGPSAEYNSGGPPGSSYPGAANT